MSVSNLLAPNDYILYINDLYANNFDSVNFGGTVTFGSAKASNVYLGSVDSNTYINGVLYPPGNPGTTGNNTFYGYNTGNTGVTGVGNAGFGLSCLSSLTGGNYNVGIGDDALNACTNGNANIGIGTDALLSLTNGSQNVSIGENTMVQGVTGSQNVALGYGTLYYAQGSNNIALGTNAGASYAGFEANNILLGSIGVSGDQSTTRIGTSQSNAFISGIYGITGNVNVHKGVLISSTNRLVTETPNVYIGGNAGAGVTGLSGNVAIGLNAGSGIVGNNNIMIGYGAGNGNTGSNNIIIGVTGSSTDSSIIRIGSSQTQNWQAGIFGVTTGTTGIAVLVDAAGQLGTVSSSRALKENIQPMWDVKDVIAGLEPVSFNYKVGGGKTVGLIADDAKKYIPELIVGLGQQSDEGVELETIQYQLLPIYLLKEIKRLQKQVDDLEAQLNILLEHKRESKL
jgi:Chaperone of endosialidase